MSVIALHTPAPDFTLDDFQDKPVSLSSNNEYRIFRTKLRGNVSISKSNFSY